MSESMLRPMIIRAVSVLSSPEQLRLVGLVFQEKNVSFRGNCHTPNLALVLGDGIDIVIFDLENRTAHRFAVVRVESLKALCNFGNLSPGNRPYSFHAISHFERPTWTRHQSAPFGRHNGHRIGIFHCIRATEFGYAVFEQCKHQSSPASD